MYLKLLIFVAYIQYIEGQNVVFDPSPENSTVVERGTARFTCVPKVNGVPGLATWSVHPIGADAGIPRTDNTTNLPGVSGVYLSPDRTKLIITGVQNSLHLTSVECRGTNVAASLTPVPADIVYILVQSALMPNGLVSLYSGSQQTFTCNVTAAAVWTIRGLSGISVTHDNGLSAANNNARITTTDTSGIAKSSTITISGFTAADNEGTIQCIELDDNSVQGTATISMDILTPDGIVSVYCGSRQTFTCRAPGKPLGWTITGLRGIDIPGPFLARFAGIVNPRIASSDSGSNNQPSLSIITISGFSSSDNGGTIQCINMEDGSIQGTATILLENPFVAFDQAAVNVPVLEGGTAIFTCKPKIDNAVGLISWSLTSAEGVQTDINPNRTNVTGSSGSFLSPDRTQLLITGVQNSLNGTRVECSLTSANAATSKCTETAYISVHNFSTVSPTLIRKITLSSRLAVVLVWSVPPCAVDYIDGFVVSVVMLTPSGPKVILHTTVSKRVRAFAVNFPEKGASYQVTVHMTMNGLYSRPLTVEVNF